MVKRSQIGFTIVELLVVIVVIGVLAAITIVSYSNISTKAIVASLQTDLNSAARYLKIFNVDNGSYPLSISINCSSSPDTDTNKCLKPSSGTSFEYNRTSPQTFLLIASKANQTYAITENSAPIPYTAPGAPSGLSAIASGRTKIRLNWSAASGLNITNYKLYRGTASNNLSLAATLGNVLTYEDTGLSTNTTYYYKVAAVNDVPSEGLPSNESSATPVTSFTVTINGSSFTSSPVIGTPSWGGDYEYDYGGPTWAYDTSSTFSLSAYPYGTVTAATLSWSYGWFQHQYGSGLSKYIVADSPRSTLYTTTLATSPNSLSNAALINYVNSKLGTNCKINWESDAGDAEGTIWGYESSMSNPRLAITVSLP